MSDYEVPDRIIFLNQPLSRNTAGKVLKSELPEMIQEEATAEVYPRRVARSATGMLNPVIRSANQNYFRPRPGSSDPPSPC